MMETEELRSLSERLRCVYRGQQRALERAVHALGVLPGQFELLLLLQREGCVASQVCMAGLMHLSPARVTPLLQSLAAAGYVERCSGADSRRNELRITPAGEEVLRSGYERFCAIQARCYRGLSGEQLRLLGEILNRLLDNLSQMNAEAEGGKLH